MPAGYAISSVQTNWFLVSNGSEQPGQQVETVSDKDRYVPYTIVDIDPSLGGPISFSAVQGRAGLYVAHKGDRLVWSEHRFEWQFIRTPDGKYQIIVPGRDLYWFDKFGIGRTFIVKSGSEAVEQEIFFNVTKVIG